MKIDGVQLTEGSIIRNLTIEGLATDSVTPNDGEVTFNTTSNTFKVYGTNTTNWQTLITDLVLNQHTTDATLHFTEASIDHTNILNIGSNSHTQIDTHIGNSALKHPAGAIVNTPAGNISAPDVQGALNGLDTAIGGKSAIGHTHAFGDLSNVTITSSANNDFVIVSGGSFINVTPATSRIAMGAVNIAGDTMTGNLEMGNIVTIKNLLAPVDAKDAATKEYVDAVAAGLDVKNSCRMGTVDGITTFTYTAPSGSPVSGVGAILTSGTTGVTTIDGITIDNIGDRVLVKDRTTTMENGIYETSTVGASGISTVLTRAIDFDGNPGFEVAEGAFTFIESGTNNANSGWIVIGSASISGGDISVGVNPILFTKSTGAGTIQAGAGLVQTGNTFDIVSHSGINGIRGTLTIDSGTIAVDLGTTALTAAPGNHNHDSTYLPLTGGTLSGALTSAISMSAPEFIISSATPAFADRAVRRDYVDNNYLPLTGGTLSAGLTVSTANNPFLLVETLGGSNPTLGISASGVLKFVMTTDQTNQLTHLRHYNTAGANTATLTFSNSGNVSIGSSAPTAANELTRKDYVDNKVNNLTINTKTASYTLVLSNGGEYIGMNVAAANNLTVPLNSSAAFPIGAQIIINQYGSGTTTITPATAGVIIRSAGSLFNLSLQYSSCTLIKIGTDEWMLQGDLA